MTALPEEKVSFLSEVETVKDSRKLFPVSESCVYLDSAHYSQFSLETRERLIDFIDEFTFTNRNLSLFNLEMENRLRKICAKLINASEKEMIITGSTTHGLNIFANGIKLEKGDCVAYPDSEFPAVVYPWMNQEKLRGIRNILIPSKKGATSLNDIERIIRENNVKVLTISFVEFLGYKNDLNAIGKICNDNKCLFIVDAIQGAGICPIDVKESGIDFLSAGSQEWMMAPAGIGFAFISEKIRDKVDPTYVATSSIEYDFKNFLDYKLNFRKDGGVYENSTPNTLGMIGLESSIELFLKLGVENIFRHIQNLQDVFINEMHGTDFKIESDLNPVHRSNILLFSHKNKNLNERIHQHLESENIFIALREGYLRLSAHIFNNEDDILALTNSLKKFHE